MNRETNSSSPIEFDIKGMTCRNCVEKISGALKHAGQKDFSVTLTPSRVRFNSGTSRSMQDLQAAVAEAGNYQLLQAQGDTAAVSHDDEKLTPLLVVLLYLVGGVLLRASIAGDFSFNSLMNNFMGGFLIIFSLFKLLNLPGFVAAYATYDLLASRSRTYGFTYPFIELTLGVAYFFSYLPLVVNSITLVLMTIGAIGVYQALRAGRKLQCACLGTALKLPMTKVTLVEDLAMGVMALTMIIHHWG